MKNFSRVRLVAARWMGSALALTFILCLAITALSVITSTPVTLPGLFMTRGGPGNGALAVELAPGWNGIVVVATLGAFAGVFRATRHPVRHHEVTP
jgi:hypothetical protein